jgi:hypothetical protein
MSWDNGHQNPKSRGIHGVGESFTGMCPWAVVGQTGGVSTNYSVVYLSGGKTKTWLCSTLNGCPAGKGGEAGDSSPDGDIYVPARARWQG